MLTHKMTSEKKVYSLEDVQNHAGENDVWMVIHGRVYDVTKFLNEHPGGDEVLRDMAGQVATEQFEDVGHSAEAREMMEEFEIGQLAEQDSQKAKAGVAAWGSSDGTASGIMTWLPPLGAALVVALLYRYYAS